MPILWVIEFSHHGGAVVLVKKVYPLFHPLDNDAWRDRCDMVHVVVGSPAYILALDGLVPV